jgi:hypothetical protein
VAATRDLPTIAFFPTPNAQRQTPNAKRQIRPARKKALQHAVEFTTDYLSDIDQTKPGAGLAAPLYLESPQFAAF